MFAFRCNRMEVPSPKMQTYRVSRSTVSICNHISMVLQFWLTICTRECPLGDEGWKPRLPPSHSDDTSQLAATIYLPTKLPGRLNKCLIESLMLKVQRVDPQRHQTIKNSRKDHHTAYSFTLLNLSKEVIIIPELTIIIITVEDNHDFKGNIYATIHTTYCNIIFL